jgi:L-alanine-DL-glutamate epimerase-like enolase superfamily enzyme
MALRLSFCPYRLLFKHPFAIAHGVRDGTDSIFIRLEQEGVVGHGEVTLPPYLEEKPEHVVRRLWHVAAAGLDSVEQLLAHVQQEELWPGHQGCRAGLHTACMDWLGKKLNVPVNELLDIRTLKLPMTLVTIGITPMEELAEKLLELPNSDALKVKVDGPGSLPMLLAVLGTDPRPILVDANQGLGRVEDAHALAETAGSRLLGMEQPFGREETGLQRRLQSEAEFPVFGDEAIQGLADLEAAVGIFSGVNIKLIKCGGLDRAKAMAERAAELGMPVMLGSMSESSLATTAMAQLMGQADLLDLDGPWLIKNDPFSGVCMDQGRLVLPILPGIGAVLTVPLEFNPLCA